MDKFILNSIVVSMAILSMQTLAQETVTFVSVDEVIDRTLKISQVSPIKALVIIDQAVPDKHLFYQNIKPNTEIKEISSNIDGLQQLTALLSQYQNLDSLHIVSHADNGVIYLGNTQITEKLLREEVNSLSAIDSALKDHGDVLFYGCNLAAGESGEALLDLIANHANVDVAASDDLTGNNGFGGDWDLEVRSGEVVANILFQQSELNMFTGVLSSKFTSVSSPFAAAGGTTPFVGDFREIIAIDQDADGDQDFIIYDGTDYDFYINDGSGGFTQQVSNITLPLKNGTEYLVADYDNDGDEDIIAPNGAGGATILQNNGSGIFTLVSNPFAAAGGTNPFIGDVREIIAIDQDADGDQDFIVYDGTDYDFYINDGSGGFTQQVSNTPLPLKNGAEYLIVDYDNDGDEDIIAPNGAAATILQNNGSGVFTSVSSPFTAAGGTNPFIGDVRVIIAIDQDADGDQDFIVYDGSDYDFYINDGSGGFTQQASNTPLPLKNGAQYLVTDYDNDGDDDIIAPNGAGGAFLRHDGDAVGTDNNPPTITVTSPTDNATGIIGSTNIVLSFDEIISAVDTGTINIYKTSDDSLVESIAGNDGKVTGAGGTTITINPAATLLDNTAYYIQVEKKVFFDADGMTFQGINDKTTFNFTTGSSNASPTITAIPASITVIEDTASNVNLAAATFTDADGDSLTVTLTANSGTLAATTGGSVTIGGSGTGTMTLAGTAANINTYLDTTTNIKYTTAANDTTARNIAIKANDGTIDSATSNVSVNITDIADIVSDAVPINNTYRSSDNLDFNISFDESVSVTGIPRISLDVGGTTKYATFISGNATATSGTILAFRYTVETGLVDLNGIVVTNSIDLNGGSIVDTDADGSGADLSNISFASTAAVLVDGTPPAISAVSIPNRAHKVGDTVTATITVTSDADDYTTGSGGIAGTIDGYALGSLSKTNNTTYSATFTITDGGTDVAAGSSVAVNFTLSDSSGNASSAYTTGISQASDAIYANLPEVSLMANTNTIAEDGGVSTLTATLSGSLSNQWPSGITVNLAYTGTGTAGTDYSKSDSIVIAAGNSSNTATVTGIADTIFDAAVNETAIVDISSLSVGSEGVTNQQTITITDAESAPAVTLTTGNVNVAENAGTSTITATLSHATYANVTVNLAYSGSATSGGTDYNTPSSSITINGGATNANAATGIISVDDGDTEGNETIIIDIASVAGGSATESGIQQKTVTIIDDEDGTAPTISAVSIPNSDHKVGDTVTATITVTSDTDDYTTGSGGISGTINGYALGSLAKVNDTTYTATFTITDGGTDVAAGSNIAVNFTLDDSSGNTSAAFTTAINQANDAIYANIPDIDLTASANTIAEDGGVSTLTATLSGSLNNQWPSGITVNLAYTGTGTAGTDYTKSDSIVIASGNSSNTATITGIADTLFDAAVNETAIVDISSLSVGNEGGTNQQTITITDAESLPTVTLTTSSASVAENADTSTITASLSHATYANVTVNLGYSGSATSGGTDYNTPSSSITINSGATSANATTGITSVDDGDAEGNEAIIIDITSVSGGSASENGIQQKTVTIIDDDNSAPTISNLAATSVVTEDIASAVNLSAVTLADAEGDNLSVTLAVSSGTIASIDGNGITGSVTITNSGTSAITLAGTIADIHTYLDTVSKIEVTTDTNSLASITLTITPNDGLLSGTPATSLLSVTPVNDAPTLSATASNPTFTEDGSAASLFTNTAISTVESGQAFTALTITITNVDDTSDEVLNLDGSAISLVNGAGTTATNGFGYSVAVVGNTATVILSGGSETAGSMKSLVDSISYQNNSEKPTTANARVVTLKSISDDGGTTNGGDDVAAISVSSTVTVEAVNDIPIIANLDGDSFTYNEDSGAVIIDQASSLTLNDVDSTDFDGGNLTVTISSGEDAAEDLLSLSVAGTVSIAANTAGADVSVDNTVIGTLANNIAEGNDLVVNLNANATPANIQSLLRAITYSNTNSGAPTTGARNLRTTVTDGDGGTSANNNVTITVAGVNDAADIGGDLTGGTIEDNGTGATGALTVTDVDTGESIFTAQIGNTTTYGTFSVDTSGNWTYDLDSTKATVQALANSATMTDIITIASVDGTQKQITITITGVNGVAAITGTSTGAATEGDAAQISGSLAITDEDTGEAVFIAQSNAVGSYGAFNLAISGNWTYDLDSTKAAVQALSNGSTLTDSFTATSADGTDSQLVTITITGVNGVATITGTSTGAATEDDATQISGSLAIIDEDTGEAAFIAQTDSEGSYGFFSLTLTGTWSYQLDNSNLDVQILPEGETLTDSFTVNSVDGTDSQVVTITITGVNDVATITGTSIADTNEDNTVQITGSLSITDKDTGEAIFMMQTGVAGSYGTFNIDNQGSWTFTLDSDNTEVQQMSSGEQLSDSFTVMSIDGTDSQVITVNVFGANDTPNAEHDEITIDINIDNVYVIDVLANDSDVDGDALSIVGANTSLGTVSTNGESLTLTTQAGFVGQVVITYTITDGNNAFSETTVDVEITGALSEMAPVITVPETVEVNAEGLFTKVDLGIATALNSQGQPVPISLVDGEPLFRPGNSIAYWQAIDPKTGLTTVASQKVIVHPIISLGKDQVVVEGKKVSVDIILNGEAPAYPVVIALSITGSVDDNDYDIETQEVTIESGTQTSVLIDIIQDNAIEGSEILIVNLGEGNISDRATQTITIVESNIAPKVTLSSSQNNEERQLVTPTDGLVSIDATVVDANDDNVNTQWLYDPALNISEIDDFTLALDPSELEPGIYSIGITVIDDGEGKLSTIQTLYFEVLASLAVLTDIDSDGDLIPDNEEGHGDSDQDGIPDFLDAIAECNVMPEQAAVQDGFLVEGEPGVCLRKGNTLAAGETGGLQLTDNDLDNSVGADDEALIVGGAFDFIATGLPQAGQSYQIVLPQIQPIPASAVYRKYSVTNGWGTFVEDVNNQLHSAAGEMGICPPPASAQWSAGLTEGHWCVQLTIEDGGPNDDDGLANGTIIDPGGVSVLLTNNTMPVAQADVAILKRNESIIIDVLENDADTDGDTLSIGVATATFGSVTITADNKLNYQSKANFMGEDTIIYSLSDGNGGTDSSTVSITVYTNNAPIAKDDSAATDDRTPVDINILANDSDADNNSLTVVIATVDEGSVTINGNNTLTYMPGDGFDGMATISYTIDDGQGEQAIAQVLVTVQAYQNVTVNNKSKGGSMGLMIISLIGVTLYRIRRKNNLSKKHIIHGAAAALAVVTSMSLAAAEPQWFMTGSIGKSNANSHVDMPSVIGITDSDLDRSGTSYTIGGGVNYGLYSFTVSYEQLGDSTASYTGDTLDTALFHQTLVNIAPKLVDGISLQGQYMLWQDDVWSASIGAGFFAWELDYTSRLNNSVIKVNKDDVDFIYNLQVAYTIAEQVQVSLKASRYSLSVNDINNIALGLTYYF